MGGATSQASPSASSTCDVIDGTPPQATPSRRRQQPLAVAVAKAKSGDDADDGRQVTPTTTTSREASVTARPKSAVLSELDRNVEMLHKFGHTLPDKGEKIKSRIADCRRELQKAAKDAEEREVVVIDDSPPSAAASSVSVKASGRHVVAPTLPSDSHGKSRGNAQEADDEANRTDRPVQRSTSPAPACSTPSTSAKKQPEQSSNDSSQRQLDRALQKQRILRQQLAILKPTSRDAVNLRVEIAKCTQTIATLRHSQQQSTNKLRQPSLAEVFADMRVRPADNSTMASKPTLSITVSGRDKAFTAWRDSSVATEDRVVNTHRSLPQTLYGGRMNDQRHDRVLTVTQDALTTFSEAMKSMPADTDLSPASVAGLRPSVTLFEHQRRAVAWLAWREGQRPPGGILADDMGLGKTLTMISLVLHDLATVAKSTRSTDNTIDSPETADTRAQPTTWLSKRASRKTEPIASDATLIICPASLIGQWQGEVERRVVPSALSSHIYHGASRNAANATTCLGSSSSSGGGGCMASTADKLARCGVVITTYGTILSEGKCFGLREDAKKLADFTSVEGDGDDNNNDGKKSARAAGRRSDACPLFSVAWRRIILDEGHQIRNPRSLTARAACLLTADRRWIVTGTPIQNQPLDLYSMLRFLRVSPFDEYKVWKLWVDNKTPSGEARLLTIVKCILLRRTKDERLKSDPGRRLVELPTKSEVTHTVVLSEAERLVYDHVFRLSRQAVMCYINRGGSASSQSPMRRQAGNAPKGDDNDGSDAAGNVKMHHILVMLLRLRQICCHPGLATAVISDEERADIDKECDVPSSAGAVGGDVLADALAEMTLGGRERDSGKKSSSSRRSDKDDAAGTATPSPPSTIRRSDPVFDLSRASSKVEVLIARVADALTDGHDKVVIVSQWTSVLDVVRRLVEGRLGVRCAAITGQVAVKDRAAIVDAFNLPVGGGGNDAGSGSGLEFASASHQAKQLARCRVLLLSLGAGGVGLNLVGANHLFLLDNSWNPQMERQACDRIYRVGQTKAVHVHRFVTADTIEMRIGELQQRKLDMADGVLTGARAASRLSLDDLKSLFGMRPRMHGGAAVV